MSIGKSFDGLVNVLAIIDSNRPFLKSLHRVLSRSAHGGIGVCFLNDCGPVGSDSGLICEIVERHDGAFEGNFAQVLGSDLIERAVCFSDRIFH